MYAIVTRKAAALFFCCFTHLASGWAQTNPRFSTGALPYEVAVNPTADLTRSQGPLVPPGVEVIQSERSKLPVFIKGRLPESGQKNARKAASPKEAGYTYLRELKATLQIVEPDQEFSVANVETDELRQTHIKMPQQYRGVPVYGGEVNLHGQGNEVSLLNGQYFPTPSLIGVIPTVSEQAAVKAALTAVGSTPAGFKSRELSAMFGRKETEARLVIYHPKRDTKAERLTWHVTVQPDLIHRWEYFIDAQSGAVLHKYNHLCAIDGAKTATGKDLNNVTQTLNTYQKGSTYYLLDASRPMYNAQSSLPDNGFGVIYTLDFKDASYDDEEAQMFYVTSNDNAWTSASSVSAHYNAGVAYEYFRTKHGRNAIDGEGGTIISLINVKDEEGALMDNAFWNGSFILYGNGKDAFKPLAGALDVAGHELTHGVVQYTANLEYQDESGAINESMADVFGALIEGKNWTIGEDVVKLSSYPSGALRSMQDPHNGGRSLADFNSGYQPAHVNEMYNGSEDAGGVHVNSGIPNKAFYLFATAAGMTKDKAGQVYYRALTRYLTRLSQFTDLRYAVVQAAIDLYGASSVEVTAARNAFTSVGIVNPVAGPTQDGYLTSLPVNPGADFVLYVGGTDNTLRNANMSNNTYTVVSNTPLKGKPSITDNGAVAYFVTQTGTIKALNLQGAVNERTIDNRTIWDNVAVSKDGTRLAAVKSTKEPVVHIYHIAKNQWSTLEILNNDPLNDGETVTDVHSLEWDYTGEKILLDASYVYTEQGSKVEYWNVGLANAWNKTTESPANGQVQKFVHFSSDVINPSFSKNSPHIIAMDYVSRSATNPSEVTYLLVTLNLKTLVYRSVFRNTVMNLPSFSRTDGQLIFGAKSGNGGLLTGTLSMAEDKLLATADAAGLIGDSKWAVWYATGTRNLLASEEDMAAKVNARLYPNPFNTELTYRFEYKGKGAVILKVFNALGQECKSVTVAKPSLGMNTQALAVHDLPAGPYVVRLINGPETSSYRLIKQ